MRLLHVDSGKEMRGGQWQALYLAIELARLGHDVKLLAAGPLLEAARATGLDAEPVGALAIARESRRVDLTHVHDASSHTLAAIASGSPIVVARRVAFRPKTSAASKWKYGRASRYVAVSAFVGGILEAAGIPPSEIDVVYDGVPIPADIISYSQRDPRKIVCISSHDPKKGGSLLSAISISTGFEMHSSRALWDDFPTASLFVYLTESEGLGSAALLAMAHGVPVIASRVGGLPEIVQHGMTGLLTGNDIEQVSSAIRRLLEDRDLAARMSAAGRADAVAHYSVQTMAEATLAVYTKVLA